MDFDLSQRHEEISDPPCKQASRFGAHRFWDHGPVPANEAAYQNSECRPRIDQVDHATRKSCAARMLGL